MRILTSPYRLLRMTMGRLLRMTMGEQSDNAEGRMGFGNIAMPQVISKELITNN